MTVIRIRCLYLILMLSAVNNSVAQDVSYDIELGNQYAAVVEMQMGLYDDVRLNDYVRSIGERLVEGLGDQPFEYSFKVVDSDMANAFALPGGFTYVTRGLLAAINHDDELAGVMAHEIIHVHMRHSVKQQKRGFLPALLRVPGEIVGAVAPAVGTLLTAPVELTQEIFDANYSRGHEKEADKMGIDLMVKSGYDPEGLPVVLGNLANISLVETGQEEKRSLVNDHPVTEKRLKYLDKEIAKKFSGADAGAGAGFDLSLLDGILYGPNPAQGVIDDGAFIHPDLGMFVQFPRNWYTENTPVMVGAMQPNSEALWALSAVEPGITPEMMYDSIRGMIDASFEQYIHESGKIDLNGYNAYTLSLLERESYAGMLLKFTWVEFEGAVYQLAAYGYLNHQQALDDTFKSFRKATDDEVMGVTYQSISIESAIEGESLNDLCSRTNCVIDADVVAALNAIDINTSLTNGQQVKVVVEGSYLD